MPVLRCDQCGSRVKLRRGEADTTCPECNAPVGVAPQRRSEGEAPTEPNRRGVGIGFVAAVGACVAGVALIVAWRTGAVGGVDEHAAPRFGVLVIGGPNDPANAGRAFAGTAHTSPTRVGRVAGTIDGTTLDRGCAGRFERAPTVELKTYATAAVSLDATDGRHALAIALRMPDGHWRCDASGGTGGDPGALDVVLPAGRHPLWIGLRRHADDSPFELRASGVELRALPPGALADGRPDLVPEAAPTLAAVTLDAARYDHVFPGTADGRVDVSTRGRCAGWMSVAPQLTFTQTTPRVLVLRTAPQEPVTLLVRTPSGATLCDRDSGYGGPRIVYAGAPGTYRVWVGARGRLAALTYTLTVASNELRALPGPLGIAEDAPPARGTIVWTDGHPPLSVDETIDPIVDASRLDETCRGRLGIVPTVAFSVAHPTALALVAADVPPGGVVTLAVRSPDGSWSCARGLYPAVRRSFDAGTYAVWLGTSNTREHTHVSLQISAPVGTPTETPSPAQSTHPHVHGGADGGSTHRRHHRR